MEKANRLIPLMYGYIVCLIAIIVTLISVSSIINSIFSLQDPIRSSSAPYYGPTANLSSYEAYKVDILTGRAQPMVGPVGVKEDPAKTYTPSDSELKTAYETARADRIASVRLEAAKSITMNVILLLIAAALFFGHWRWLSRVNDKQ